MTENLNFLRCIANRARERDCQIHFEPWLLTAADKQTMRLSGRCPFPVLDLNTAQSTLSDLSTGQVIVFSRSQPEAWEQFLQALTEGYGYAITRLDDTTVVVAQFHPVASRSSLLSRS